MRTPIAAMLAAICRRGGGFGMMVLEVALGMAVVSHCVALGAWFVERGTVAPVVELDRVSTVDLTRDASGPARLAEDAAAFLALPEVVAAVPVDRAPYTSPELHLTVRSDHSGERAPAWVLRAGAGAAELLGGRLLSGRMLRADDVGTATRAASVLITQALAERLFGSGDALGRGLTTDEGSERLEVVGLLEDLPLTTGLAPRKGDVLVRVLPPSSPWRRVTWLVRWRDRPLDAAALARALSALAPQDLSTVTLRQRADAVNLTLLRAETVMLAMVKVVAGVTLLGSLGMAVFLVHARRRQIGIMRALGATARDVSRYFIIENCLVTGVGIALGVLVSYALHAVAVRFEPTLELHPATLAAGALTFWLVGVASAWLPARTAAKVPPGIAR